MILIIFGSVVYYKSFLLNNHDKKYTDNVTQLYWKHVVKAL